MPPSIFRRNCKFTVPLVALLVSDVVLNFIITAPLFVSTHIVCRYLGSGDRGLARHCSCRIGASLKTLLPASIVASVIFYVITNAFSWLSDPGYAKNFAGLVQALTVGLPQYSATPTWMFFRNSLVSDLFFTALFVALHELQPERRSCVARRRLAAAR